MVFGQYLKEIINKRGYSYRQLAMLADIDHTYISKIVNGKTGTPSPEILKKLSRPLGVPYQELMAAAGYLPDTTPVTTRDIKQYENFIEHAQTFFMDDEVAEEDKEKIFRDITELFWESKEKNKKKYGRKKKEGK